MTKAALPAFISRQVLDGRYWFSTPQWGESEQTVAVCGGYEAVAPDYHIRRQGFTFRTIELVVGGGGTVELGGRSFPLAAGVSYAYGPAVPHRIRTDPRRPLRKYFLCFGGRSAGELLASGPLGSGAPARVADPTKIGDLFDILHDGMSGGHSVPIGARLVEVILLKLADAGHAIDGAPSHGAAETFRAIRRYLKDEFLNVDSIEQVADRFNVSSAYLARLFRRFERTAPHVFLTRLKMGHAASLLMSTGCRVKDVADRLGYSDPFHFSRAFKAEFGISPREFVARTRTE